MKVTLKEGKLTFVFDVQVAKKWDDSSAYRNGVQRLAETGAVDFALKLHDETLVLLEVKDMRDHRIENKDRDLAGEVAAKVRDTLSGLYWASKRRDDDGSVSVLAELIARRNAPRVLVVLWLEEDRSVAPVAATLVSTIESELRPFLNAKVVVTSRHLEKDSRKPLSWVSV